MGLPDGANRSTTTAQNPYLMTGPDNAQAQRLTAAPFIQYREIAVGEPLPPDVLCAVSFGSSARSGDPRCVRVGLQPLRCGSITELWHASGPLRMGFDGPVRYAEDGHYLAGAVELDERRFGGIAGAAMAAYAAIRSFQAASAYPYLLRMWNYFDAINQGDGDTERYKQFCVGRTNGLGLDTLLSYPAATAIGRRDADSTLQVYWLAGRHPGVALENPRQVSAYRYPRQYGPVAPAFSRAMLVSGNLLMVSGTASIIGHVSRHPGNLQAQIEESLANVGAVLQRAVALSPALPARFGAHTLLKIYLRHPEDIETVEAVLRERVPTATPYVILAGEVCRKDLLFEIDCIHGAQAPGP